MDQLFAGILFLMIGLTAYIFNRGLGKRVWIGMPSVVELIKGEDIEKRFSDRAKFIKLLGIAFMVVGAIILIRLLIVF